MSTVQSEALRAALEFEQRGHDYYKRIADQSENPLTKGVFAGLAQEELYHMDRIRELSEETGAGESLSAPAGSLEDAVRLIFEGSEWTEREAWTLDNAEAYEYATNLEREGHALYTRFAEEAESEAERVFFRALLKEELKHLTALENVYNYLQHTGDWFASEEIHVWNWMNT